MRKHPAIEYDETAMGITTGLITVRGPEYHPNLRLAEAARERGHRIILVHPYRVWPDLIGGKFAFSGIPETQIPDIVLPRQGATIGESCLALIHQFCLMGIPVVNNLDSIRISKNKFLTLQVLAAAGIPIPDTLFVNSKEGLWNAVKRLGGTPLVAKQVSGRQGTGVILFDSINSTALSIKDYLDRRSGLLIQRFIPPAGRKDIRVLVIGGEVAGAMELKPREGDFRANFHLSGESYPKDLPLDLARIAVKSVAAVGLDIGGVDLLLDKKDRAYVIEVNYSPGFKGLEAATGIDIAGRIVDYAVEISRKNRV